MERDARRAAGLPGTEPTADDEDDDSDSEEILDLVPEVDVRMLLCPLSAVHIAAVRPEAGNRQMCACCLVSFNVMGMLPCVG